MAMTNKFNDCRDSAPPPLSIFPHQNVKVAHSVSQQFFFMNLSTKIQWYVEIKQFSKVDIKQNNISTVILLIKSLIYQ